MSHKHEIDKHNPPTHEEITGNIEAAVTTPVAVTVRNATHQEAVDFVHSAIVVEEIIEKEKPNIVIMPQRGASPIRWAIEELTEQKAVVDSPKFMDIPIGTAYDVPSGTETGITKGQKTALIRETLEGLRDEEIYIPGESKLMIIDEVQKGGTITQAARSLQRTLEDDFSDQNEFIVVAVQDSRRNFVGSAMTDEFKIMVANEAKGVKTYSVSASLFTVDRNPLLDIVATDISKLEKPEDVKLANFQTIPNYPAREFFKSLVRMTMHPKKALKEIEAIRPDARGNANVDDIDYDGLDDSAVQMVLTDFLTDPREIKKPVNEKQLFEWIGLYLRKVIEKKKS